jgi:hypothetical protein
VRMKGSCGRVHAVWAVGIGWIMGHTDVLTALLPLICYIYMPFMP